MGGPRFRRRGSCLGVAHPLPRGEVPGTNRRPEQPAMLRRGGDVLHAQRDLPRVAAHKSARAAVDLHLSIRIVRYPLRLHGGRLHVGVLRDKARHLVPLAVSHRPHPPLPRSASRGPPIACGRSAPLPPPGPATAWKSWSLVVRPEGCSGSSGPRPWGGSPPSS